jgi:hypothetical protein
MSRARALFPQVKLSAAAALPPAIAKSALHKAVVRNSTLGVGLTGVPLAANLPSAPKDGFANNEVAVNRHQSRRRSKKNMGTHVHKLRELFIFIFRNGNYVRHDEITKNKST